MSLSHNQSSVNGETPFSLVDGIDDLIPVKVDLVLPRVIAFSEEGNSDYLRKNLDLLDELRERAAVQLAAYQRRITGHYNAKVHP